MAAQLAGAASLRIKFDHLAGLEGLHLSGGTRDCPAAHVDLEVRLGEQLAVGVPCCPWFGHDLSTSGDHVRNECAVDVRPINGQLAYDAPLPIDVGLEFGHRLLLW